MKIGIIGAGFGGLSAGYRLAKKGFDVTIFEADDKPGGLAVGFKEPGWKWSLEQHYHHWFYSDRAVRKLAKEINYKVDFPRPVTSTYLDGKIYRLDSPISLLKLDKLPILDRLRTGATLGYLKLTSDWRPLEKVTAESFLKKYMGEISWRMLWQPLFAKKFSEYAKQIPASWFWARIKKRSARLGYPRGGFLLFAQALADRTEACGGSILFNTPVKTIEANKQGLKVTTDKKSFVFDKVIFTLPFFSMLKIVKGLPAGYQDRLISFKGLGALNLMLSLKKRLLEDGTYWLNINETEMPFISVVEHTNFVSKRNYSGEHIVYIGNYLVKGHPFYLKSPADLFEIFLPYIQQINPEFSRKWINKIHLFSAPFAQPVPLLNYSKKIPAMETPIKNLYLSNIQQVYPWDRGTNYAVESGEKVADLVIQSG